MCANFENKMAAENTMALQENMNNDMLLALLVASHITTAAPPGLKFTLSW